MMFSQSYQIVINLGSRQREVGAGYCPQKSVWLPLAASQTLCLPHPKVGKQSWCNTGEFQVLCALRGAVGWIFVQHYFCFGSTDKTSGSVRTSVTRSPRRISRCWWGWCCPSAESAPALSTAATTGLYLLSFNGLLQLRHILRRRVRTHPDNLADAQSRERLIYF